VRSTAAPYTESRLTRSVANERVGFPVVEQIYIIYSNNRKSSYLYWLKFVAIDPAVRQIAIFD
jgi:hypothetical protein